MARCAPVVHDYYEALRDFTFLPGVWDYEWKKGVRHPINDGVAEFYDAAIEHHFKNGDLRLSRMIDG